MNAIACAIIFAAILLKLPNLHSVDEDDKSTMFFATIGIFIMVFAFAGATLFMVYS